jgi:transcriptional regulator of acetoin/glycerol metabolism
MLSVTSLREELKQEIEQERQILFKLFFDMRKDVNELKRMFVNLIEQESDADFQTSTTVVEGKETLNLAVIEKACIIKALEKNRVVKEAAEELGISERTLYRKFKVYNIKH